MDLALAEIEKPSPLDAVMGLPLVCSRAGRLSLRVMVFVERGPT